MTGGAPKHTSSGQEAYVTREEILIPKNKLTSTGETLSCQQSLPTKCATGPRNRRDRIEKAECIRERNPHGTYNFTHEMRNRAKKEERTF